MSFAINTNPPARLAYLLNDFRAVDEQVPFLFK
jgi:hypothetical protein